MQSMFMSKQKKIDFVSNLNIFKPNTITIPVCKAQFLSFEYFNKG